MLFKYTISLEMEVEFEAPLLGVDTSKGKRNQTDVIAKKTLAEMIKYKTTSYVGVDRVINEDNLKGTIVGDITLRSARMIEEDKKK
jgi:hypothetical protein